MGLLIISLRRVAVVFLVFKGCLCGYEKMPNKGLPAYLLGFKNAMLGFLKGFFKSLS